MSIPPGRENGSVEREANTSQYALREVVLEDVWSRTEPKYRRLSAVLLLINALVFGGLCCFAYWVQTHNFFDFDPEGYSGAFSLGKIKYFVLEPISIDQVRMMIPVLGLLLGVMIAVPILVAQLYRFPWSLIFLAEVFVIAHMPVLACVLLLSCYIAGGKWTRLQFKYASTLLGLIPVVIYFYLAIRPGNSPSAPEMAIDDAKWLAPWGLAVLSAAAIGGAVLVVARLVNMRPGAIAPVMTISFAVPVLLFHRHVGMDELEFRVLYQQYGPYGAEHGLSTLSTLQLAKQLGFEDLSDESQREAFDAILSQEGSEKHLQGWIVRRRDEILQQARAFLERNPDSRYVPNVIYVMGRAFDIRPNVQRLNEQQDLELYFSFPSSVSRKHWKRLVDDYGDSDFSVPAYLQLARLEIRDQNIHQAMGHLKRAIEPREKISRSVEPEEAGLIARYLAKAPPNESIRHYLPVWRDEARSLLYLVEQNRDDPVYGNEPLAEFMRLDFRHREYPQNLARLGNRFNDSSLYDNLLVREAEYIDDIERQIPLLREYADRFKGSDGGAEALMALAAALHRQFKPPAGDVGLLKEALSVCAQVVQRYPGTPHSRDAVKKLEQLGGAEALMALAAALHRQSNEHAGDVGLLKEARSLYDQVVQRYPGTPHSRDAIKKLESLPYREQSQLP
jgi:hypothetical protein